MEASLEAGQVRVQLFIPVLYEEHDMICNGKDHEGTADKEYK